MRVALFNDTSSQPHVGCLAVTDAHNRMLRREGAEVAYRFYVGQLRDLAAPTREKTLARIASSFLVNVIKDVDAVVVNGEGTIHHGAGMELLGIVEYALLMGRPAWLVNAVFQELPWGFDVLRQATGLTCREPESLRYLQGQGVQARLVPDSILEAGFHEAEQPSDLRGRIVVTDFHPLRRDVGGWLQRVAQRPDAVAYPLEDPLRFHDWRATLARWSSARLVVTGRHHGVYLAAMAGVPFIALGSNTWKVEGNMAYFSALTGQDYRVQPPGEPLDAQTLERAIQTQRPAELREALMAQTPLPTFAPR